MNVFKGRIIREGLALQNTKTWYKTALVVTETGVYR